MIKRKKSLKKRFNKKQKRKEKRGKAWTNQMTLLISLMISQVIKRNLFIKLRLLEIMLLIFSEERLPKAESHN
jgi:hypothetical protein